MGGDSYIVCRNANQHYLAGNYEAAFIINGKFKIHAV